MVRLCNRFTKKDLLVGFDRDGTLQSLVIGITKDNLMLEKKGFQIGVR